MSAGFPWDAMTETRDAIAAPDFAYDYTGATSPATDRLALEQLAHDRMVELGIAHATFTRPHDLRDLESKAGIAPSSQFSSEATTGTGSSGGSSSGSGSGSSSGSGPPQWWKNWIGGHRGYGGGGYRPIRVVGGGGGRLLGPSALGRTPLLGNVPAGATTPSGPNPLVLFGVIAVVGVGGYFLWHRLRVAKAQDKQLDQGKEPVANAA